MLLLRERIPLILQPRSTYVIHAAYSAMRDAHAVHAAHAMVSAYMMYTTSTAGRGAYIMYAAHADIGA